MDPETSDILRVSSLMIYYTIWSRLNMVMMDIGRGKMVEVSSDEEGFLGAWFTATILESMGKNKFLVQYHNLKTDDLNPASDRNRTCSAHQAHSS
ncbi:Agenet domain [Musa troglodytarum]|uniref:Agenet domain n=1 Tax=Musa troglodytarum TaxID=320322 RepID=A0A9E7JFK2_9LILI|nr:Agenet domain [Musa troglodytarum]